MIKRLEATVVYQIVCDRCGLIKRLETESQALVTVFRDIRSWGWWCGNDLMGKVFCHDCKEEALRTGEK